MPLDFGDNKERYSEDCVAYYELRSLLRAHWFVVRHEVFGVPLDFGDNKERYSEDCVAYYERRMSERRMFINKIRDYFWEFDESATTLQEIRERLVNYSLFFILIVGLPGIISSLLRAGVSGWKPVMSAQIIFYLTAMATAVFRQRIGYYGRTAVLIGSFLLLGIVGLWSFGLAGIAVLTFAAVCLLTAVLLGNRAAIAAFFISALLIVIAALGTVTGTMPLMFDANAYIASPSAWIFALLGLAVMAGFSIVGVGGTQAILQKALQQSEGRYHSIADDLPGLICSFQPDGTITFVNEAFCHYFNRQAEDMIGQNFADLIPVSDRKMVMANIASLTADAPQLTHEHQVVAPGQETRWQRWTNRGLFDENGQIISYQSFGEDITEQKQAETALKESEARLHSIFLAAPVGIGVVVDRKILRVNDFFCDMLGYSHDELIGRSACLVYPTDEDFEFVGKAKYAQIEERNIGTVETRFLRKDGQTIQTLLSSTPIDPNDLSVGVTFTALDITERKQAEAALMESEERYRTLVEMSPDGIALHRDDKLIYANVAAANLLGAESPNHLVGRSIDKIVHPDHWETTKKRGERMAAGAQGLYPAEDVYLKLDGTAVPVEVSVAELMYQGETAVQVIFRDISQRKQIEQELARNREKLETLVAERTAELQQRVAEVERLNAGMVNLLADLQAANEKVTQTAHRLEESNAELESFAYSVSHDLRAPLRHISGFVNMLQKRESGRLDEKSAHFLQVIAQATTRMGQLIDDLLSFSRTGRQELFTQPVDVNKLVSEARQELALVTENRNIAWKIDTLPTVTADAALLRQVWANLLENAIKYTAPREEAHIEIGVLPPDENDEITFFVRDNGVGFDDRYVDKLFGVFQRLHRDDEFDGTGIGLATVRRIISRHNGRAWAEGKVGEGATFYFTLPNE